MKISANPPASVILLGGNSTNEQIVDTIGHILKQTYKNIEIILCSTVDQNFLQKEGSRFPVVITTVKSRVNAAGSAACIETARGEIIFYKAVNHTLWSPRHIEIHLREYNADPQIQWTLSRVEYRRAADPEHPIAIKGLRREDPPTHASFLPDEISHLPSVEIDWKTCFTTDPNPVSGGFSAGLLLQQWQQANIPGAIPQQTTVLHILSEPRQPPSRKELAKQLGAPKSTEIREETIRIGKQIKTVRKFPTLLGNVVFQSANERLQKEIDRSAEINSIGVKRTMGMGDVLESEPILRKLKQKYHNATLTFYTANAQIIPYFATPVTVKTIHPSQLTEDYLAQTEHELKIDLDLSYESRGEILFVDAYSRVAGITFDHPEEKIPQLNYHNPKLIREPYVVVVGEGSGWPGKTWPLENYAALIRHIKSRGFRVVEPGMTHFTTESDPDYRQTDFDTLVNLIAHCDFFVGADNGPLHIARAFRKPCFTIAGAALPYFSSADRKQIYYLEDPTAQDWGCKHKQFFNITEQGLSFVPKMTDPATACGMNTLSAEQAIQAVDKFLAQPISLVTGTPMRFYLNIPACSYYIDPETGLIQREEPEIALQKSDINLPSESVSEKKEKSELLHLVKNSKKTGTMLVIGQKTDFLMKEGTAAGLDTYGLKMNTEEEKIAGETERKDRAGNLSDRWPENYPERFDILLGVGILEQHAHPLQFLQACKNRVKKNGWFILRVVHFGSREAQKKMQRWEKLGNGENLYLFTKESLSVLLKMAGFKWEVLSDAEAEFLDLRLQIDC